MITAMADSKIVRQLRYHHAGAPQQSTGEEAPVRAFGSGHQAIRPGNPGALQARQNASIIPGAPDGPVRPAGGPQTRNNPSPNPPGLTRRPGQISVTPGIGDDCVKVGRALAPSQLAMATNPEGFRVDARPVVGHVTPTNGAPSSAASNGRPIRAVVALQGLTSEQRDLLDMLIDDFCGIHAGDAAKGSLVELAQETKRAIARIPVTQATPAAQPAQELESLETPVPAPASARPTRVGSAHGRGGTNPPGEVKIFAPHTQPFETLAGRNSNETTPQT